MKNKKLSLGIMILLLFSLCACGNAKRSDPVKLGKNIEITEELAPEYSYVAEYLQVPEKIEVYQQLFLDDQFYCFSYEQEGESDKWEGKLVKMKVGKDGFESKKTILTLSDEQELNSFCTDSHGNVYTLLSERQLPEEESVPVEADYETFHKDVEYYLIKYDATGKVLYKEMITDTIQVKDYFYVIFFAADDRGNCCIYNDEMGILLYDQNGKYLDTLKPDGNILNLGVAKDGNLYFSSVERSANGSRGILQKIDFEQRCLGDPLLGFQTKGGDYSALQKGLTQDILYYDQEGIYEYSMEKQESTKVLSWMDVDIDPLTVRAISPAEKERIYVLLYQWNGDNVELAALKKVRTEEIVQRENITVGMLFYDASISTKVMEFNKKSEKYHVSIKTYLDLNDWSNPSMADAYENFKKELLSGQGPDIVDLYLLDIRDLVEEGVIEDLAPYLQKSSILSENDFFPKVIKGAMIDGKLTYLPSGFSLCTMVAKTSVVGPRMGWSLQDMMKLANEYKDVDLWQNIDKMSALDRILELNYDQFIDQEEKTCHFDSPQFREILEFANSFKAEREYDTHLQPLCLQEGSILLADAYIYDFEDVQRLIAYFDGEYVNFIGYPSLNGGNGCILSPTDCFGMSAFSEHKEGAWQIIEEVLLADEGDSEYRFCFPSRIESFERQKERVLNEKYAYDADGNLMLDEIGEPMIQPGIQFKLMGENGESWDYVTHPVTEEEIAIVEKLIEGAKFQKVMFHETEAYKIISEEAGAYFSGNKSVEEAVNGIQERMNLYFKEDE